MTGLLKLEFVSLIIKRVASAVSLSKTQLRILMAVGDAPQEGLKQMDVLPIFDRDAMTLSQVVKKLIKMDYVKQETDPKDRRIKILFLTKSGRTLYKKALGLVDKEKSSLANAMGKKKLNQLEGLAEEAAGFFNWP